MMIELYARAVALLCGIQDRSRGATSQDRGFTTLEWVIIALGLFLVAGAAVAIIVGAINNRVAQIN
jgi:hypothetical protein